MMTVRGCICAFTLAASAACPLHASTWTVSFDPTDPVKTTGWDLSQSSEQAKTSVSPAGRKLAPNSKGDSASIESPLHVARIRSVSLSFKCVNVKTGNSSKVEVFGRASAADDYRTLFAETGLPGSPTNLCSDAYATPLPDFDCRQVKIVYTKDTGNLVISSVSYVDDAICAETPTNLRTEVADAEARLVRVSWDLADGLSDSEWRTFTTASAGGLGESETLWRETFDGVPAVKATRLLDASALAALGFGDWGAESVRQPTVAGALQLGTDKGVSGSLATPPLGRDFAAGQVLVVRASARDVASGVMPVFVVAGGVTLCVAEVAIAKAPQDVQVALPALAAADRIIVHSITNVASRATLIHDLAICAPGAYRAECVVTNACSAVTSVAGNSAELAVPADGTSLWIEVRSVYDDEPSEWTAPFAVTLSGSGAAEGGDETGGEEGDDPPAPSGLAAPSRIRAGRLPGGKVRVGWAVPDGATNVKAHVWTVSRASGGLAAVAADDVLWRETFSAAPATNSTVKIDTETKLALYADKGSDGWDAARIVSVALATETGAIKVGIGEKGGALVSKRLGISGDGMTLVVTAKRGSGAENSGVTLRAATLSDDGAVTNELGRSATLAADWTECAFSVAAALTGDEALLVETVLGTPKDGRAIIDDIALVRNYAAATVVTNETLSVDCGVAEFLDLPADDAVRYVSLAAQGADGQDGEWTEPLAVDPSALGDWKDRFVTMKKDDVSVVFALGGLPASGDGKGLDVSESPFLFFLDGDEQLGLASRDATKQLQKGVYVCTNVFERDWAVLVPGSPDTAADVRDAECRLTVRTDAFAARRIELSGTFAQLNAANREEKALSLQYRAVAPDGAAGDWRTLGEYRSSFTSADASPDLAGTQKDIACAADVKLPRGAAVEARVWCRKEADSGREPPLGFRDFRVRVIGAGQCLVFVVR